MLHAMGIFIFCFFATGFAAVASETAESPHALQRGRELSGAFLTHKTDVVWAQMTSRMQQAFGDRAAFDNFREQVATQLGNEVEVLQEKTTLIDGASVYTRIGRWSGIAAPVVMQWAFDSDGSIEGFFVRPDQAAQTPAPTAHLDYDTKTPLHLPFAGSWNVIWGGRALEQNRHIVDRGQRFAYDLLILHNGSSHRGSGADVADYYCWNEPILAPAAGRIAVAVDGVTDQKPGVLDPAHAAGNHVIIDLGHGEYALLAHLRQNSVKMKPGDVVKSGQELGRCGNSGNTSEPHLHFHLQDTPRFGDGDGLPAFFDGYVADGKPIAHGEPVKGQVIAAQ